MTEFLEQMNSSQFKEIESFFETMPKLKHTLTVTNPKTKVESEVVLRVLVSFFGMFGSYEPREPIINLILPLMQYHKYSLTEIENLIPWERDIYVALLQNHLEEEKLKQQQANGS